jgi:putative sigma-54 modulation protein
MEIQLFTRNMELTPRLQEYVEKRVEGEEEEWEEAAPPSEEAISGKVVRVKRFEMFPMTPEEAIEQMELLGHQFFVFLNAEEGSINVVYRRRDGDYGLIIPELR